MLLAKLLKGCIFLAYRTFLPYELDVCPDVILWHWGVVTVIHPNTAIGRRVRIANYVTIVVNSPRFGGDSRVVIGNDVTIGTGAALLARDKGVLTVGDGAIIGANPVVTRDVPPGAVMVGPTATMLKQTQFAMQNFGATGWPV